VFNVPDAGYGPDRYVFQPDATGRRDENPDVHGHLAEDQQV